MSLKLKSEDQFKILLESLWSELIYANTHFLIFNELRKNGKKHLSEINFAPAFWRFTFHAHIGEALSHLIRVYDQHNAGVHLRRFLETVRDNPLLFKAESFRARMKNNPNFEELIQKKRCVSQYQLKKDILLVSAGGLLVKRLKEWRDFVIAHKNSTHVLSKKTFEMDHPLPYSQIGTLIKRGFQILNRYSNIFDANKYGSTFTHWNDVGFVLKALKYHPSVILSNQELK